MTLSRLPVKTLLGSVLVSTVLVSAVSAAEPIEGVWQRSDGTIIQYAKTENGEFCGIVVNTSFSGQSIGCMAGSGGQYEGKINKLDVGKTYDGKAELLDADTLKLTGCALGGVICRSEDLVRQQ